MGTVPETTTAPRHRLVRPADVAVAPPTLDETQRRVVEHPGGPLLVLAGPGTGKTTTLVESVVHRIEHRGQSPDEILVLTFSRKAAAELRSRITARLGRSAVTPLAMTFHSFCHALIRRFADPDVYGGGIRLLTAPEQEFRVRETLAGSQRVDWPDALGAARRTRAFAAEVRAVLAKTRQLGMDPDDLVEAGRTADRPDWIALGEFFDEYLDVLDAEQVLDYAELVHRCRILLTDPEVVATLRREVSAVFVDEYQDTDPSQVQLLKAVAGDGRDVCVVGDPDQSIYAFRGAEARGILDFPDQFPTTEGERAPVLALGRTRRFGSAIAAATRRVADRLPVARAMGEDIWHTFRSPEVDPAAGRGRVEVFTCAGPGAEAEHIADLLRSAHLRDGLAWDEMAVLVRSGRRTIPGLCRALVAAGVPVEVAGDEIPLSSELAVRPLLLALDVAARGRTLNADEASRLLLSPLGGLDSMALRRLGRALREAERAELGGTALPRLSGDLIFRAIEDPSLLAELPDVAEVRRARSLAELLITVESLINSGATPEEALWGLWSGTNWPGRLRSAAFAGGDTGRKADRDLDAVCSLFDIAARSEELSGRRGVTGFLAEVEAQEIPADTLREGNLRGAAVRVLTAHRSKGLEWPLVVVASVQEGGWPDVRRRGSLLEADRLGRHGLADLQPPSARIAEERRLFYVACTRASRRLVVTAVAGTEGEGDQPSRFLSELGVGVQTRPGRPRRPLSLTSLIGQLRATSVDPEVPPRLREAAAARLAKLADARDDHGLPLAAAADPSRWWGMEATTRPEAPVIASTAPVRLSGSQLAGVLDCPRQWFLSRKAHGEAARNTAASFGSVVHVLVEHSVRNGTDPAEMAEHLDQVWDQLEFDAAWLSSVERAEAEAALERYAAWHEARSHRELLGVEVRFETQVDVRLPDGGTDRIHLTGIADRVERDPDGRIHIIDFKTGRRAPTKAQVAGLDQLGVYQLAVQQGAFAEVAGEERRVGGAELVYLRLNEGKTPYPKVFSQASLDEVPYLDGDDPGGHDGTLDHDHAVDHDAATGDPATPSYPTWVHEHLARAAEVIRHERFEAKVGDQCRYCPFRGSCPAQSVGKQVVQ